MEQPRIDIIKMFSTQLIFISCILEKIFFYTQGEKLLRFIIIETLRDLIRSWFWSTSLLRQKIPYMFSWGK